MILSPLSPKEQLFDKKDLIDLKGLFPNREIPYTYNYLILSEDEINPQYLESYKKLKTYDLQKPLELGTLEIDDQALSSLFQLTCQLKKNYLSESVEEDFSEYYDLLRNQSKEEVYKVLLEKSLELFRISLTKLDLVLSKEAIIALKRFPQLETLIILLRSKDLIIIDLVDEQ